MGPSALPRVGTGLPAGRKFLTRAQRQGRETSSRWVRAGSEPRLEGKTEKEEGWPPCGQNPVPLSRKGQVQEAREGECRKRDHLGTWNCLLRPESRKGGQRGQGQGGGNGEGPRAWGAIDKKNKQPPGSPGWGDRRPQWQAKRLSCTQGPAPSARAGLRDSGDPPAHSASLPGLRIPTLYESHVLPDSP